MHRSVGLCRVGNLLIGFFSDSLVLFERQSDFFVIKSELFRRSFVLNNLREKSLMVALLFKATLVNHLWLLCKKRVTEWRAKRAICSFYKKAGKNFINIQKIRVFSNFFKGIAHFFEWQWGPEQLAHSCSFVMRDPSKYVTVAL